MKSFATMLLLFGLAASTPAVAADAPQTGVSDSVRRVLQVAEAQFLSVAEAMPAKLYGFAPSGAGFGGVRTFSEQVKHVACSNFAFFSEIEHKTPPEHCEKGGPSKASTKEELLKYLRDAFDYGNTVLAAMTDNSAQTKVQGQYWGNNTSLTVAVAAVWHIAGHYGQLVPYLRLNNIIPPPTQQYPSTVR
ncbi:MAG TPA: DinB family protein [Bryobacteraceae bacterium]|nr:DinB family protein [Bryobacteraceae bacterium]